MTYAEYRSSKYFPNLDGLRFLSVLAVTAFHAGLRGGGLSRWGHHGVTLFFAISGFLITTLLLREKRAHGFISLKSFYIRRTLRIMPLYYAVLAFYVVMIWPERNFPAGKEFFHNLPNFITYTANWTVRPGARFYLAWSLATEEQFYLFWPTVIVLSRRWFQPVIFIAFLLVFSAAVRTAVGLEAAESTSLTIRILSGFSPAICLGCLLAYALDGPRPFAVLERVFGGIAGLLAAGLFCATSLSVPRLPAIFIEFALASLVAVACVSRLPIVRMILSNPVVRHIGIVSYGMYLLNLICVNAARRIAGDGAVVLTLISFAFAVLSATVVFYTFEKPFTRLRERFHRGLPTRSIESQDPLTAAAPDPSNGGKAPTCKSSKSA